MKTLKNTLIALLIVFGSSTMLTGCFVDADEEIYDQLETQNGQEKAKQESDDQWD